MRTTILANEKQLSPDVVAGDDIELQASKLGQLFTAGWKQRLLLAGKLWRVTVGPFADAADPVYVSGGGAGTFADLDQPEMMIGVGAGYYLFCVEAHVSCKVGWTMTVAAGDESANILLMTDRSQFATDGTKTTETPDNMLDGAGAFPGSAYSAYTADMTDPVLSEYLAVSSVKAATITAAGLAVPSGELRMDYEPEIPSILAGPAMICLYWGGQMADGVGGIASVIVGCVPSSWFPVT